MSCCSNWRGEMLTAMRTPPSESGVPGFQRIAWRQAASSTQAPIGSMRPVSSASGMNWPGGMMPRTGSFQRSSASTPTTPPL